MAEPYVVEVERSGTVESTHLVDVAVLDGSGALVASAGDPDVRAAFRSSAKPLQARVSREVGWEPPSDRLLALACASHTGEPAHVAGVREILAAAEVPEDALACPEDVPFDPDAALAAGRRARVFHNCSGKHAGMLAACRAAGFPLSGYRDPDHPLQERVRSFVEAVCGPVDAVLVDGCGVPTFVTTLRAFARGFGAIADGPEARAMRAHPFDVGGTGRIDTELMTVAPAILSKGGAEGLACVAAGDVAIAIKVRDGTARARPPVLLAVLRELGLLAEEAFETLAAHASPPVLGGGRPVGRLRVRGSFGG